MPRFQILPVDETIFPVEIEAPNPAEVLNLVQRLDLHAADVSRDGEYCFSVRLGENGMWCIYQRLPVAEDRVIPLAG
jgi:hypothetical protein